MSLFCLKIRNCFIPKLPDVAAIEVSTEDTQVSKVDDSQSVDALVVKSAELRDDSVRNLVSSDTAIMSDAVPEADVPGNGSVRSVLDSQSGR